MTLQIQAERSLKILIWERDLYESEGGGVTHHFQNNIDAMNGIGTQDFWNGDSYFTFTSCNDFGSTVSTDTIWINRAASVQDLTNDYIKFYPNPVKDFLYINGPLENVFPLSVYNGRGQMVKYIKDANSFIDMSDLECGTYMLFNINAKNKRKTMYKIIRQK